MAKTPVNLSAEEHAIAAERLLRDRGLAGVRVRAAGRDREIAAVHAPLSWVARLTELAPEVKALGFRYVALDLAAGDERSRDEG